MVRCVAIHAAYFPILFHSRLLAVPLLRLNFESAPLFFCRRRPLATTSGERRRRRVVRIYKTLKQDSAVEFLQTGELEVASGNGLQGVITFQSEVFLHTVNKTLVLFEFETSKKLCSCSASGGLSLELVRFNDGQCDITQKWTHKLGADFALISIALFPKCDLDWRLARSCLRSHGRDDVVIKVMQEWQDKSHSAVYVDEEYVTDSRGLMCLKYNPNHSWFRDETVVKETE